uniref:Uncharacterized protein n=1 Tax=Myoviridae sp. ctBtT5 TaxID=2825048 RepID=A0A8S5PYK3_9CAUD|nr:MAG TPA: hypothetical protein [Myoviridae sp. ctBtT5]
MSFKGIGLLNHSRVLKDYHQSLLSLYRGLVLSYNHLDQVRHNISVGLHNKSDYLQLCRLELFYSIPLQKFSRFFRISLHKTD